MRLNRKLALSSIVLALLMLSNVAAQPPSFLAKGTFAEYTIKVSMKGGALSLSFDGNVKWEVVDVTTTDIVILVTLKISAFMMSVEYKYKVFIDKNTGKLKKIVILKGAGKGLDVSEVTVESWWGTNLKQGSTIKVGKYRTAKVVGEAVVTDAKGRQWSCWKAVDDYGFEYYYDKVTGLLIKAYGKRTQDSTQVEVTLLLKDTNISPLTAGGFLGVLGYLTIGGMSIPILLLLIIIIIIVVLIVVLVVALRGKRAPPAYPAPTYPTQPPPPPPPQQQAVPTCPTCGQPLTWIPQYKRWYCYRCGRYV
ncbi:MAG: hypothetical protein DRJ52_07430 [Thermoprotei archaeon]|nr:MAG: hypothetical protein DRJ52_07430 [Thermoprotei archaeon]RLE97009.1 MAG: hypothetical protein DRJ63_09765 [Thermoprotei archaeon]